MPLENMLQTIGKTPLVKLAHLGKELPCNLYAKCEFFNPGGSIKDRIALYMVEQAEKKGKIQKGATLIEATSGNTGIGLAIVGAVKGYKVLITMPEKMSGEKQRVLEALGAKIIRTPTKVPFDHPESHIEVAKKLEKKIPNSLFIDQYNNPSNIEAHYLYTAKEILDEVKPLHMLVAGVGTGGSITGVGKKIKEIYPEAEIVGADPEGSILSGKGEVFPYEVEGIGYDFIPHSLDRSVVDSWVKTNDKESFRWAKRLIKEEGVLCGGSSGSALQACMKEAKKLKKGQNCVVILPDGVRNYMTKFLDENWLKERGL